MLHNTDKKYLTYAEIDNASKPVYIITVGDLQIESQIKLGRLLTDDEIEEVRDKLEWGIGTSLDIVYDAAFKEMG
jgi:hypothetical protein